MKRFELWQYDKETDRIEEARKMRPDRMVSRDSHLQFFIDRLKKNKTLPIGVYSKKFNKQKVPGSARSKLAGDKFDQPPLSAGNKAKRTVENLKVSNINEIVRQVEAAMLELDPAYGSGSDPKKAQLILSKIKVKTPGRVYSFFDIDETAMKVPGESPGGQSEAHTDQALQCVTSACMANGIWPLARNYKKISKFVRIGNFNVEEILKSRDDPRFRNKKDNWVNGSVATHRALEKKYGSLKGYVFVNENDSIHKQIYDHAGDLMQIAWPDWNRGMMERWNPADIWAISDMSVVARIKRTKDIEELNKLMLDMYPKELIAISMKKPGLSAAIKVRNNDKDQEGLTLWEFETKAKSTLGSSWFQIQGGYEYKAKNGNGKLVMASYSGHPSQIFLIEDSGSKSDGAVGGKNLVELLSHFNVNIPQYEQMWNTFKEGYPRGSASKFWKDFAKMYDKYDPSSVTPSALREEAYALFAPDSLGNKPGRNGVWCTYNNLVIMEQIENRSQSEIQRVLQGIYRFASSMSPISSVHIVVGKDNSITDAADNSKKSKKRNPKVKALPGGKPESFAASEKEKKAVRIKYPDESPNTLPGMEESIPARKESGFFDWFKQQTPEVQKSIRDSKDAEKISFSELKKNLKQGKYTKTRLERFSSFTP